MSMMLTKLWQSKKKLSLLLLLFLLVAAGVSAAYLRREPPPEPVVEQPPLIQLSLEEVVNESRRFLGFKPPVLITTSPAVLPEPTQTLSTTPTTPVPLRRWIVVIDPGHQAKADLRPEKLAPWSEKTKPRVTGGTTGRETGVKEYALMLELAELLKKELEARGINAFLTRTRNDVNVSNRQRAEVANSLAADLFIRLHANGSEDATVRGALVICQPEVPQLDGVYQESRRAGELILARYCELTGIPAQGVVVRDDITGLNWSRSPAVLIELGYLTNPEEERFLTSEAGKQLIVQALANGIEAYLNSRE